MRMQCIELDRHTSSEVRLARAIEYTAMLRLGSAWLASRRFTGVFGRGDPADRWQRFLSQAHVRSERVGANDMRTAVLAEKWASSR